MTTLDKKQVNFITTAVYATLGDLDNLKIALGKALDEGMTINEAKEAMLHIYAYAGFPRSINATNVLRVLIDDRASAGKKMLSVLLLANCQRRLIKINMVKK